MKGILISFKKGLIKSFERVRSPGTSGHPRIILSQVLYSPYHILTKSTAHGGNQLFNFEQRVASARPKIK